MRITSIFRSGCCKFRCVLVKYYFIGKDKFLKTFINLIFSANVNGPTVMVERLKRVSLITLNRPDKQNAFNKVMLNELATALKRFEEDKDSGVAIINGAGGSFSIGYDIDELKTKERLDPDDFIVRNYMTKKNHCSKFNNNFPGILSASISTQNLQTTDLQSKRSMQIHWFRNSFNVRFSIH